uniref:Putative terminase n=1 Tax=viral metagenome TaxID=1070528 RepID=A0A6M3KWX4_9ZZZZ
MSTKLDLKPEIKVRIPKPKPKQQEIIDSKAQFKIIRAGRRFGKTWYAAISDILSFLGGHRVLYGAPTIEQVGTYWRIICKALQPLVNSGLYRKNESEHYIESVKNPENRIKAKTCWNANTLRGDYADKLTLDEFQLMAEDTWNEVGLPMLLDNNGSATFIYTPPSLYASGVSRARDPRHASKMFIEAQSDTTGLWGAFHYTSFDNPTLSKEMLALAARGMSEDSYRREIMAEDDEIEQSWLVHGKFNERLCLIDRIPIPYSWPVFSGHDFGKSNPGALFVAQNPGPDEPATSTGNIIRKGDYVIFYEYLPGGGLSPSQHAQSFKEITKDRTVIRSVGGNRTGEDEVRIGYAPHGWVIVEPRISRVNAQLERVYGLYDLNKVHVFNDLKRFVDEMSNCLWELDDEGHVTDKIKNEARYHLLACWRYIGSDFTPEVSIGKRANQGNSLRRKHGRLPTSS